MTGSVTLPTWIFVVLLVFGLWALLERLLVPGARWYLRRRLNLDFPTPSNDPSYNQRTQRL